MNTANVNLGDSRPFSGLDAATLGRFQTSAQHKTFSTGDVLFHELSEGDEIFFILEGSFRISVELASAYNMVEEITGGPGELVGEGRFIEGGPRSATITAASDLKALVWDVADWKSIAEDDPMAGYRLAVFVGQVLFARVSQLKDHLIDDMAWGIE